VDAVEHVTFSGTVGGAGSRNRLRHRTLRARLLEDGLVVREIAPGVDLAARRAGSGAFPVRVDAQLKTMDAALFRDGADWA